MQISVSEIIEAAGGADAVGKACDLKEGVRKWPQIGIPDRYWQVLIGMVPGLTPQQLYEANLKARGGPRGREDSPPEGAAA